MSAINNVNTLACTVYNVYNVSVQLHVHCSIAQFEWPFCHITMCSEQWSCFRCTEEDPTDCEFCKTDQQISTQWWRLLFHANLCLSSKSTGTFLMVCNPLKKAAKSRLNMKIRKEIWSANFKSQSYGDMIGAVIYQTLALEVTRGVDCIFESYQAVFIKLLLCICIPLYFWWHQESSRQRTYSGIASHPIIELGLNGRLPDDYHSASCLDALNGWKWQLDVR